MPAQITEKTRWSKNGRTVAGGQGQGGALNQLHFPLGLDVNDDGTLFIADTANHRIVRWKPETTQGEVIAGGTGPGNRLDQLDTPVAVLLDRTNNYLIISDYRNTRVMRWSLQKTKEKGGEGEVIVSNIACLGLAMDKEGSLYVSDARNRVVRRYGQEDGREGVLVADILDRSAAVNLMVNLEQIAVDADHSVYVTDPSNHLVMQWSNVNGEVKGVLAAGGGGRGSSSGRLSSPSDIFVDRVGSLFIVDQGNHRVMRRVKGAKKEEVLLGGNGRGSKKNQFDQPSSISFDDQGNLYVVDLNNHRIQRFDLEKPSCEGLNKTQSKSNE